MSARNWYNDFRTTSQGILWVPFSFLTNNASNPAVADFRGCGGLTGSSSSAGVSNSGPSAVASITRTDVGTFLVTFADGYRHAVAVLPSVSGTLGFTAEWDLLSNEGSGRTTACTMAVRVCDDEGVATETTGRRVCFLVAFKDSGNGS